MRKNYIVRIIIVSLVFMAGLTACGNKPAKQMPREQAQSPASVAAISPADGARIYSIQISGVVTYDTRNQTSISSRVGGRIERLLIKYNYQPVRKGQLIMEIYSPDLAAAQRELLFISRTGNDERMLSASKQRLQLLGLQPTQIGQVIRSGKILYRVPVYSNHNGYILEQAAASAASASLPLSMSAPASSVGDDMGMNSGASAAPALAQASPSSSPVLLREGQYVSAGQALFTIYQAGSLVAEFSLPPQSASEVKRGQKLLYYPITDKTAMAAGTIGLVEPSFGNGKNFTSARVYLKNSELQPGQLLIASLPVTHSKGWWVPKKAVRWLGTRAVVFKKEKDVYVPMDVQAGAIIEKEVQIMTDIGDWKIASNAIYLVDSESFIKTSKGQQ